MAASVYPAGIGIWVAQSSGNRISHNDIHDLLYSGMSIGWNWDDAPNRTHHNTIELNHVHDLGHGVLSDMGLIYCLGVSPGSVIRNNVFHDIWPYSEPAAGLGHLPRRHLRRLPGREQPGLQHALRRTDVQQRRPRARHPEQHLRPLGQPGPLALSAKQPNTFRHNIVYLTQGELLVPYGERSLQERLAAKEPLGDVG